MKISSFTPLMRQDGTKVRQRQVGGRSRPGRVTLPPFQISRLQKEIYFLFPPTNFGCVCVSTSSQFRRSEASGEERNTQDFYFCSTAPQLMTKSQSCPGHDRMLSIETYKTSVLKARISMLLPTTSVLHTETVFFPVVKYRRSSFQLRGSIRRRLHARRTSRSFVISLITAGSGCSAVSSCPAPRQTPKRIWWQSPDGASAQPGATSGGRKVAKMSSDAQTILQVSNQKRTKFQANCKYVLYTCTSMATVS